MERTLLSNYFRINLYNLLENTGDKSNRVNNVNTFFIIVVLI